MSHLEFPSALAVFLPDSGGVMFPASFEGRRIRCTVSTGALATMAGPGPRPLGEAHALRTFSVHRRMLQTLASEIFVTRGAESDAVEIMEDDLG